MTARYSTIADFHDLETSRRHPFPAVPTTDAEKAAARFLETHPGVALSPFERAAIACYLDTMLNEVKAEAA